MPTPAKPSSRPVDLVQSATRQWVLSGLVGLALAVTLAVKAPLAGASPAVSALFAIACGWMALLVFAPWRQMTAISRRRRQIVRLTQMLKQVDFSERDRPLQHLVINGRDELAELSRVIRDTLGQGTAARLRTRQLERTMEHTIRRETDRATTRLRREANTDPLTGLYNRRALDEQLSEFFHADRRRSRDVMVVMIIDLDRFKPVNDTLGHDVGDQCLALLGHLLRSTLRREDMGIRIGGDEFAVLMPNQSLTEAEAVARRIQALFGQMSWPYTEVARPTLSVGMASARSDDARGPEGLFRRADSAMYAAKNVSRSARTAERGVVKAG